MLIVKIVSLHHITSSKSPLKDKHRPIKFISHSLCFLIPLYPGLPLSEVLTLIVFYFCVLQRFLPFDYLSCGYSLLLLHSIAAAKDTRGMGRCEDFILHRLPIDNLLTTFSTTSLLQGITGDRVRWRMVTYRR